MNRALVVSVLCLTFGCSLPGIDTDDGGESKEGKSNTENAKSGAKQQTTAIANAMDGQGQSAADGLYTAGSGSQSTISAKSFGSELSFQTLRPLADPPGEAGCTCTGGSCTFTDCARGAVKLNGTLEAKEGSFKCDLTWDTDGTSGGQGSVTKIHVKADMTVSATSIKGTMHTDGSTELKGISTPNIPGVPGNLGNTSWVNDATWDVTVKDKAATAGSVVYTGSTKVGDTTYTGNGTVTFP